MTKIERGMIIMKKNNIKKISLVVATLGLAVGATGLVLANNHANASSSNTDTSQKSTNKTRVTLDQVQITQDQAISKFTEKYGNKSINEVELETHKDKVVYKIEGFDSTKEYKVIVDATSGKVLKAKSEKRHKNDKETALDLSKVISSSEALAIAQKQANGEVVEISLESENGKAIWEVKLVDTTAKTKTKVEIDATSQKVLKVDKHTKKESHKDNKKKDKEHKKHEEKSEKKKVKRDVTTKSSSK